jgi:uncharacterized protein (TIGR00730 family)
MQDKQTFTTPLTKEQIHEATQERVYEISREFTTGFKFLEKFPRSVTFFGSARTPEDNPYYIKARSLASRIVQENGHTVITGGGPGIMEAANRGAKESGGHSIGLTIRLPKEQVMNDYMTDHIDFYYFFSRKVCLAYSAEAFLFFPGGYGTLDEFFEIVTLLQTKKIPKVPVILVGKDFWEKALSFITDDLLSRENIDPFDLNLFSIIDDEDEILSIIKNVPVRGPIPYEGLKVNPIEE